VSVLFLLFLFLQYLFISVSFSSSSLSQFSLSFPLLLSVNFSLSHWMCMSQESLRKSESSRWKNTKRSFKPKDCCVSWCIFSIKHGNIPKWTQTDYLLGRIKAFFRWMEGPFLTFCEMWWDLQKILITCAKIKMNMVLGTYKF
jgi:hypothetical protein